MTAQLTNPLVFEKKHLLAEYRDEILKQLTALKKVANRVGVPEPTWTIGETYEHAFEVMLGKSGSGDDYTEEWEQYIEPVFDISINLSECIKMAGGWRLVAAINHRSESIIQVDADFELPVRFSPKKETCEHCNVNMPRVMSYVIYSEEEGFKQVGKSCLKQFLGINPTSYISMFEAVSKFSPFIESMGYAKNGGGRLENLAYSVEEIFKLTYHVVQREDKFVKNEWREVEVTSGNRYGYGGYTKNVRTNSGESTSDKVNEILLTVSRMRRDPQYLAFAKNYSQTVSAKRAAELISWAEAVIKQGDLSESELENARTTHGEATYGLMAIRDYALYYEYMNINEEYKGLFVGMLDWAKNLPVNVSEGGNMTSFEEYKVGVKDVMSKQRTLQSRAKYIVSGFNMFTNDLKREAERKEREAKAEFQTYIGTIGQKSKLTLTITGYKTGESNYGMWELWSFVDEQGNAFSKFGKLNEKYITGDLDLVYNANDYINIPNDERAIKQPKITASFEIKDHKIYREQKVTELGRISKP